MNDNNIADIVKAMISAEVIKALNAAPEAIEKLVQAALLRPVDAKGSPEGYGAKMPYLDYLVGNEIRGAAQAAVRTVIKEKQPLIEEMVRKGLSAETLVAAVTQSVIGVAEQDWKINVSFVADK